MIDALTFFSLLLNIGMCIWLGAYILAEWRAR